MIIPPGAALPITFGMQEPVRRQNPLAAAQRLTAGLNAMIPLEDPIATTGLLRVIIPVVNRVQIQGPAAPGAGATVPMSAPEFRNRLLMAPAEPLLLGGLRFHGRVSRASRVLFKA